MFLNHSDQVLWKNRIHFAILFEYQTLLILKKLFVYSLKSQNVLIVMMDASFLFLILVFIF